MLRVVMEMIIEQANKLLDLSQTVWRLSLRKRPKSPGGARRHKLPLAICAGLRAENGHRPVKHQTDRFGLFASPGLIQIIDNA
jgi:hypothetical protein